MDSQPSTPKLVRRNAAKNFEYTPTPSTSSTPFASSSSAPRTRSLDLRYGAGKSSLRVEGNDGELKLLYERLGLSGPEDFEIPKEAWEFMKSRSSSDVVQETKKGLFDFDEPEECKKQETQESVVSASCRPPKKSQMDVTNRAGSGANTQKFIERVVPDLGGNGVGKGGGIKGDRPPLLTPPSAMPRPIVDDRNYPFPRPHLFDEEAGEIENVPSEGPYEARIGETVILSGSSSFITANDDDDSSTTTEPLSVISPNGPNLGMRVRITEWEKGALLGSGSFGAVYEGISSEGRLIAVKEVSLVSQGSQGMQGIYQLEQEIELLSQFEHENIVQYYGTDKNDSKLYIFLERMQDSLANLYFKYPLRDSLVSNYTRQILLGLKYLHDRNVVHRDIKCANILVASTGTVKLADFGLAKATRLNDLKSCKGTPFWMAPEVLWNKGYGLSADIWSLGCTILEMLSRHVPYYPLESHQALFRIGKGVLPPFPDVLSKDARDFIQQCLKVNPSDRPTAAVLLEHPFVQRTLRTPRGSESLMLGTPL